jgi:hypothetical protein
MGTFTVDLAKYLGAAVIGNSGASERASELDKSSIGPIPVGLASVPNPFIRLERGMMAGRSRVISPQLDRPVLVGALSLDDMVLPLAAITVSGRNTVISTAVAGRDHVVNEIISFEQWSVKIQGFVVEQEEGGYSPFPSNRLVQQVKLFRKGQAVKVECEYLRLFGIHYLVLTDVQYPDMAGTAGAFAYEFSALSDEPVELELK